MTKPIIKPIALLLMTLTLSACSAKQQFDCPYKEGARCLSVSEIDQRINSGQLDQDKSNKHASSPKKLELLSQSNSNISPVALRTPETVLMAWIAPYYTTDGIYHEEQRIHFVASAPTWINVNPEIMGEPQ